MRCLLCRNLKIRLIGCQSETGKEQQQAKEEGVSSRHAKGVASVCCSVSSCRGTVLAGTGICMFAG
jgi:hypothetical protein